MTDTEYVAMTADAWGKGSFETEAIENLAANHRDYGDGDITVTLFEVQNFKGFSGLSVHAEEILSEEELTFPVERFEELHDLQGESELLAEDLLVEANR